MTPEAARRLARDILEPYEAGTLEILLAATLIMRAVKGNERSEIQRPEPQVGGASISTIKLVRG